MKTEEGNEIILKFFSQFETIVNPITPNMIWIRFTCPNGVIVNCPGETYEDAYEYLLKRCRFHSSWDWLMPVVDKIENLPTSKIIERPVLYCNRDYNKEIYAAGFKEGFPAMDSDYYGNSVIDKTKILAVWQACVNFINWYNENSNQNEEK